MSAHVFSDAVVLSKRRMRAGDIAVLALALAALSTVVGALWFANHREPPAALAPPPAAPAAEAEPEPVRAHPLPPRRVRAETAAKVNVHRAEPARPLPEYDPFANVERVSAEEMEAISQARESP